MRGYPDLNFPEFHRYAAMLRAQGHEVFSPAEAKVPQDNIRACMATDMDWICREAEAIAMMPGWVASLGAIAELATVEAIGLKTLFFHQDAPNEKPYLSELPSWTISPWLLPSSPESPSPDNSNMAQQVGIDLSRGIMPIALFVIILSVVFSIPIICHTLQRWLGGP